MNLFNSIKQNRALFFLILMLFLFAVFNKKVTSFEKVRVGHEMQLALPASVQLLMFGGDRYFAANIGTFRAVTVGVFQLKPETYSVLASVQQSAAKLNPRHEDNYYTAAAILAWNDQVDAAQEILKAASNARSNDALPPFFHGFNRYYFFGDYRGAAEDMLKAAERSEAGNRIGLTAVAAKWYERGQDPHVAIDMIQKLAKQNSNQQLKQLLGARVTRLEGLVSLTEAADRFRLKQHRKLERLDELVETGELSALPVDPLGMGYTLNKDGLPILNVPLQPNSARKSG